VVGGSGSVPILVLILVFVPLLRFSCDFFGLVLSHVSNSIFTDMAFAARVRQLNLTLALDEPLLLIRRCVADAMRTADTFDISVALPGERIDWHAAGVTLIVLAFFKVMIDGNPIIKDKALTSPQGVFFWHGFQIFKDTSLQVVDLLKTLSLQIGRGLLTANAPQYKTSRFFYEPSCRDVAQHRQGIP
jgi:hypothetical protein